jgi:hypothetical protein
MAGALIEVRGEVVYRKHFPPKDGHSEQMSISVQAGSVRYGMYVPMDSPIAVCELGDLVAVKGELTQNGQYLNLRDAMYLDRGRIVWDSAIKAAKPEK